MIIGSSGSIISPLEVEKFLNNLDDVAESLVTLTRNSDQLDILTAFICVSHSRAKMILNQKMVDEFRDEIKFECAQKFADYKRPEVIYVLSKFPENPNNGKIYKKALVECCDNAIDVETQFGILIK
jgi:acyl-coenzyme A synthetase/AMP-(fatty) acid ligase